ncbi:MAG TPA: hypothetical protein DCY79_03630 [Planctomycetaceae bacterium]|nr:hypothetical protein [Blastopirellula sp.]HAY78876.1 hypothetical protein [Planctomycetaceae bacterium]
MNQTLPCTDKPLAAFQAELLELLDRSDDPDQILRQLQADSRWLPLGEFLADIEPRMLEVAVELVKTWGRRSSETGTD